MPYKLFKVEGGWKVGKKEGSKMSNGRKYASNKPLSKEKATAQMKSIIISEKRSAKGIDTQENLDTYFGTNLNNIKKLENFLIEKCDLDEREIKKHLQNMDEEEAGNILNQLEKYDVTPCSKYREDDDGGDSGL